jgi:hypothetical protein
MKHRWEIFLSADDADSRRFFFCEFNLRKSVLSADKKIFSLPYLCFICEHLWLKMNLFFALARRAGSGKILSWPERGLTGCANVRQNFF